MTAKSAFAPAKVNLSLHVTGQRADGYHLLDSLVMFADIGDHLTLTPAPQMALTVTGPFAAGVPADHRNLVWQAARLAGWTGHIHLEKNIPHGAGLGGGSADAAAVLRALEKPRHAAQLGADVPVCLVSGAARMRGTGERVHPIKGVPPLWAVLANPRVHVATPQVFGALASCNNPPMPQEIPDFADHRALLSWLTGMRNDLEAPALATAPVIRDVLNAFTVTNAYLVRMSGSGATCCALYDTQEWARGACRDIQRAHPDWWAAAVQLS